MRPNLMLTVIAGLVATPVMTAMIYLLAAALGLQTELVGTLAEIFGGWRTGMIVHILNGAVPFPLMYVFLFHRWLPGRALVKGVSFGILLWAISQIAVLPLMGAGFFGAHIGGVRAVGTLLLAHVVYGGFLGGFPTLDRAPAGTFAVLESDAKASAVGRIAVRTRSA